MVSYKEIQTSNELINNATAPRVSVFVGGTSGIGMLTVKALVATGTSVRIYLVGRKSSAERMKGFIQELHAINSKAELIWTEGGISLLAETRRVCEIIKSKESRLDLLFLTAGYIPFGARNETAEGLETAQSLEYYSRMLFVLHLLPLLSKSEASKVISVLGGGLERASIDLNNLDLKKSSGMFGGFKAQTQCVVMNTIALDKLANNNSNVTFIHSWPGWVNTGNVNRGVDPNSIWAWIVWLILEPLIRLFSISDEISAQRYLFQSTSAIFGGRGVPWTGKPGLNSMGKPEDGLFLVNFRGNCTPNAAVLTALRVKAQGKVWEHTQEVLRPYL